MKNKELEHKKKTVLKVGIVSVLMLGVLMATQYVSYRGLNQVKKEIGELEQVTEVKKEVLDVVVGGNNIVESDTLEFEYNEQEELIKVVVKGEKDKDKEYKVVDEKATDKEIDEGVRYYKKKQDLVSEQMGISSLSVPLAMLIVAIIYANVREVGEYRELRDKYD